MALSWVSKNDYLSQSEMKNNAKIFYQIMNSYGFTLQAISAMLGNIQAESGINPGIWESLSPYTGGYGLVQWTPYTKYSEWAGAGWENNGNKQCERINFEFENGLQWSTDYEYAVDMSSTQFKTSTESVSSLAIAFLWNYENPYVEDATAKLEKERQRSQNANEWYVFLQSQAYVPRLDYTGTDTLAYYREWNPYFAYDGEGDWIGMNNCTAYAFGRWNELAQVTGYNTNWPIHDGSDWYADGVAKGFDHGTVPMLGAAISWTYPNGGHVAIVEEIQYDSNGNPISFTTSNSAYNNGQPKPGTGERGPNQRGYNDFPWFYLETIYMNNLDHNYGSGSFNGFIYHPDITPVPPVPPTPTRRKMPFIFYLKRQF